MRPSVALATHDETRCTERHIGTVLDGYEWEIWIDTGDGSVTLMRAKMPGPIGSSSLMTVAFAVWSGDRIEVRRWLKNVGAPLNWERDLPALSAILRTELQP